MAFGCLALTSGTSAALAWQSMHSKVTPYVVEVDQIGEARAVRPAEMAYQPTDPQIAWYLARFINNVRTASLDPVLMRQGWLEAYDFTTRRGSQFLNDYARGATPFAHVGERTVSVQVTSVIRASDKSFQIKWTEAVFERGSLTGSTRWTAILTIVTTMPTSADVLRKNPLGIYVDAIDWSREFDAAAAPSLPAPKGASHPAPTASPGEASNLMPRQPTDEQEIIR